MTTQIHRQMGTVTCVALCQSNEIQATKVVRERRESLPEQYANMRRCGRESGNSLQDPSRQWWVATPDGRTGKSAGRATSNEALRAGVMRESRHELPAGSQPGW